MDDPLIRRTRDLLEARVWHDLVALDVSGGKCFGFNETAAWTWQLLDQPRRRSFLRDSLLDRFEMEGPGWEAKLDDLLHDLERRGLIQSDAAAQA